MTDPGDTQDGTEREGRTMRKRFRLWRARRRQRTFIYCPSCRYEMVAGGEWLGQDVTDPSIEAYRCANCDTFSRWLFDAPAPILLATTMDRSEASEGG